MRHFETLYKCMTLAELKRELERVQASYGFGPEERAARFDFLTNEMARKAEPPQPKYFTDLHQANLARDAEWTGNKPGLLDASFRANESAGETGEAIEAILDTLGYTAAMAAAGGRLSNIVKKLERERLGLAGSRAGLGQVKAELADVVICAFLNAMHHGFDLWPEVIAKFNATTEKMGLSTRLAEPGPSIALRPAEIQSGLDRVKWAEGLIKQLPEDHDGRNSWLLNYGTNP